VAAFVSSVLDERLGVREGNMKRRASAVRDSMRPEYDIDYSTAVRGKYYRRLTKVGVNVVVLDPDVAKAFPDSKSVNDALRAIIRTPKRARRSR
jgi:hypothetical protein